MRKVKDTLAGAGDAMTHELYPYIWYWRARLPQRHRQPCRVLARGRMNSVLVQFPDGFLVVTSRYAVRKIKSQESGVMEQPNND